MKRRGRRWALPLSIALAAGIALAYLAYSAFAGSPGRTVAAQAALRYVGTEMVWTQGPTITHERTGTMGALPRLLPTMASTSLRKDVNTADLIRRFGPQRRIDIIVLSGVYNSLPPDEGVNVRGEALVLVDARTDRVLFLTT